MKTYEILVKKQVIRDLNEIRDFIIENNSESLAYKYVTNLLSEIQSLKYLAGIFKSTKYNIAKNYHSKAKLLITKNKKWYVVFHVYKGNVVVDKILAAKLMKN